MLNSLDSFDTVISDKPMDVMFAYSMKDDLIWHGPNNRIVTSINFFKMNGNVIVNNINSVSNSLKILHGISMYTAFAFVYPLGIFVARYYQNLGKWLSIHQTLLSMVTSNVIYYYVFIMIYLCLNQLLGACDGFDGYSWKLW